MDSDRLFQRAVRQVLYPTKHTDQAYRSSIPTKRGWLCLRGIYPSRHRSRTHSREIWYPLLLPASMPFFCIKIIAGGQRRNE